MSDNCVCCGEIIPEGRQVCRSCEMKSVIDQGFEVYKLKNKLYGSSFDISCNKYGLISALTRMSDKWNRIEYLILNDKSGTKDESLIDSLSDLANYCNMTICHINAKKTKAND